ncbi:glucose PTS transporter subunit IIA [Terrisporobacter petrolearius]|uniref:PTS transporter subunit IIABC n=1 Tax=Terrisporobacter petrolearius TaxID=1460447 RepID=UPI003B006168
MKDKLFGVLQRVGRSFMLPIAILPVAGLFLGIGGSFTNETMLKAYGLMGVMGPGTPINAFLTVLSNAGDIVFANLPLLFAMGVAIGMAKKEKEVAALSGAIAFLIMHASIGAMININGGAEAMLAGSTASVLGINSLQMGVFGGMIVGLGVAALHNRFYKIELPQVLSFFGGTRFIPIISAITYLFVGILMFYIWPNVQNAIYSVGNIVQSSGYAGTWVYGFMERALIPFGLHHVFYLPFWQTAVGGTAMVGGQLIEGAQNIFFAQLADPSTVQFSVEATRFMSGKFPLMIFGLPGAALAMYKCAKPEKRKVVGGLLLSAALTAMLTGITEPIEFTFLFVAPILYVIHSVFAGAAYMIMHILNVGVGMTFSGGLIDLTLFGVLQGNAKTHWLNIIWVGLIYFAVYYFLFTFLIKKFNFKTPGRDDEEEVKLYTRADVNAKKEGSSGNSSNQDDKISAMILKGLGGRDNLSDLDCCATRLRVTVKDSSKVSESLLKSSGAAGVIIKGNGIQVIYGPRVTVIKSNLEDFIASGVNLEVAADLDPVDAKEEKKENKVENNSIIVAPIEGNAIYLEEVGDGVFSEGMLGKGVAIEPAVGRAVSPVDGVVSTIFDTKHAVGLTSDNGVEVLIHIGLDTVKLNGKYFTTHVKAGDRVKAGDLLVEFDIEKIKEAGYPTVTPVIVTNTDSYKDVESITKGSVKEKDKLISVK